MKKYDNYFQEGKQCKQSNIIFSDSKLLVNLGSNGKYLLKRQYKPPQFRNKSTDLHDSEVFQFTRFNNEKDSRTILQIDFIFSNDNGKQIRWTVELFSNSSNFPFPQTVASRRTYSIHFNAII